MREQGLRGELAGWVKFPTEFIPLAEKRNERKEFTQPARRTDYQDADQFWKIVISRERSVTSL